MKLSGATLINEQPQLGFTPHLRVGTAMHPADGGAGHRRDPHQTHVRVCVVDGWDRGQQDSRREEVILTWTPLWCGNVAAGVETRTIGSTC